MPKPSNIQQFRLVMNERQARMLLDLLNTQKGGLMPPLNYVRTKLAMLVVKHGRGYISEKSWQGDRNDPQT